MATAEETAAAAGMAAGAANTEHLADSLVAAATAMGSVVGMAAAASEGVALVAAALVAAPEAVLVTLTNKIPGPRPRWRK